jgi:hypothetical protein
MRKAISEAALKYMKPEGKIFEYGTAGVSHGFDIGLKCVAADRISDSFA